MCVERKETMSENSQRLDDKTPSTMSTMTPQLSFNSPFSPHLRCCMLWPVCRVSRLVGHHYPLGEPFAWMTCSKYEQLFSKLNVMIKKNYGALHPSIAAPEIVAVQKYLHDLPTESSYLQL
jgi:hypothetical protein